MQAEAKGEKMHTSTPAVTSRNKKAFEMDQSPIKEELSDEAMPKPIKREKVTKDLVLEAVRIRGIDKKGVTLQTITQYIGEVRGENSPDVTLTRIKNQIKKIILDLLKDKMLARPRGSGAKGVAGLFQIKPITSEEYKLKVPKVQQAKKKEVNVKNDILEKEKPLENKVTKKPMKKKILEHPNEKLVKQPSKKIASKVGKLNKVPKSAYSDFEEESEAENQPLKKNKTKEKASGLEPEEKKAPKPNLKVGKSVKNETKKETTGKTVKPVEEPHKEKDTKPTQKSTSKIAKNKTAKAASSLRRKDLSDTEIDLPTSLPKNLKAHASDTELEVSKRIEKRKRAKK